MEIIFNALIRATGWSIIHSLWQGAIIYTLLLLLFLLNPRLSAKTRHNLSLMAIISVFLWFVQTFYTEFSKWVVVGKGIQTFANLGLNNTFSVERIPFSIIFDKAEQSIPLIVFIYIIGLAFQILLLLRGYYMVSKVRTTGLVNLQEGLVERFSDLSSKLRIKRTIRFVQSSLVSVPLAIGYFKPMVLLPLAVLTRFSKEELETIVIHELSHIRRNDFLLNILKISIETILFFNPFVWLSAKIIDTERENACDDLVLKITGTPLSYAMTLLELEKLKHKDGVFSLAITGKNHCLLNRIKRITNMKTSTLNLKLQLFAILIIISGAFSLAWMPKKKENSEIKNEEIVKNRLSEKSNSYPLKNINSSSPDTLMKKFKIIDEYGKENKKEYINISQLSSVAKGVFLKQNKGLVQAFFIEKSDSINEIQFKTKTRKNLADSSLKIARINLVRYGDKLVSDKLKIIIDSSGTALRDGKPVNDLKFNELICTFLSIPPEIKAEQREKFLNQFYNPELNNEIEALNKQLNLPDDNSRKEDIQKSLNELKKQLNNLEIKLQIN